MANNFVKWLDLLMWRPTQRDMNNAHGAGVSWCSDKRSDISRNPFLYQLFSNTVLNRWNIVTKWQWQATNPGLGGTFGAGATSEFAPSRALEGNITTGCTDTKIVTSTVITAIGTNMLANRWGSGDYGYKIRIIGKTAGKIEERFIIGNTGGTTPTVWLDKPLTFTPTTGDTYEILGGAVYMLGAGVIAATSFRSMEVAANAVTSLSNTNLPGTISTDSYMTALDEQYTPYNIEPWCGMILGTFLYDDGTVTDRYALVATGSGASSLTGQVSLGDAVIIANEYRNFQIRVVQDTTTPSAVWQRRIIASHTAWPSPVYTLGTAWTVTPSTTAKYVIEMPNLLLLRSTATATLYVYNYNKETINNGTNNIVANAWSTAYFGTPSGAVGAGCMIAPSFGIQPDIGRNARHSVIYFFRGANGTVVDTLDIAGAIAGTWASTILYDGNQIAFNTGACGDYAPCDNEGRMFYINAYVASINNQIYRFDVQNRVLSPYTPTAMLQSGTAAVWNRIATYAVIKSTTEKYTSLFLQAHLASSAYEIITQI